MQHCSYTLLQKGGVIETSSAGGYHPHELINFSCSFTSLILNGAARKWCAVQGSTSVLQIQYQFPGQARAV
jgi:hypothetical protein